MKIVFVDEMSFAGSEPGLVNASDEQYRVLLNVKIFVLCHAETWVGTVTHTSLLKPFI